MISLQTLQAVNGAISLGGAFTLSKPYPKNISTHPDDGFGQPVGLNEYAPIAQQVAFDAEDNLAKALAGTFPGTWLKYGERATDSIRKARQIVNGLATSTETYSKQPPSQYLLRASVRSHLADIHERLIRVENAERIIDSARNLADLDAAKDAASFIPMGGRDWIEEYLATEKARQIASAQIATQPAPVTTTKKPVAAKTISFVKTVEPTTKSPEQVTQVSQPVANNQAQRIDQAAQQIGKTIDKGVKIAAIVGGTATAGTLLYFIFRKPKKNRK